MDDYNPYIRMLENMDEDTMLESLGMAYACFHSLLDIDQDMSEAANKELIKLMAGLCALSATYLKSTADEVMDEIRIRSELHIAPAYTLYKRLSEAEAVEVLA